MAMNQKRAAKGGEVGTNGEFYEGGKYMPSTVEAKRKQLGHRRGPRKVQIAPYTWTESREDAEPIFQIVSANARYVDRYKADAIEPDEIGMRNYGRTWRGVSVATLCEMYNRGERWYHPVRAPRS